VPVVAALPQVFFEDEIAGLRKLLKKCARAHLAVEVNNWGGWWLAREAGVRIEAGPGLPVLNSLAAGALKQLEMRCVTLSIEADRRQLEEATSHCPVACSLVVFGRPPLVVSRVELDQAAMLGKVFADRRGAQIVPRLEQGLWVFRPVEPFDLRGCTNGRIRVQHLVVDLVGSPDPLDDWHNLPLPHWNTFRFNYDRALA
jgi:hypothetical protein